MERRHLDGMLQGLGQGLQQIGLQHALKTFSQAAPMTGTGVKQGNAPSPATPQSDADNDGDAGSMEGGPEEQQERQPGDYIIPARPSTLAQEAHPSQNPAMQIARRRLDPGMTGRRRL